MGLKPGTFKTHPERLGYDASLSDCSTKVLLAILQSTNEKNECFVSQKYLSEILKKSMRTIQRSYEELKAKNYIQFVMRGNTTPMIAVLYESPYLATQKQAPDSPNMATQKTVTGRQIRRVKEAQGRQICRSESPNMAQNEASHNIEERNIYNEMKVEREKRELKFRYEFIKNLDEKTRKNYLKNREQNTPTTTKEAKETNEWREMYET